MWSADERLASFGAPERDFVWGDTALFEEEAREEEASSSFFFNV